MVRSSLDPSKTALLILDVQDKIFASVERAVETLQVILQLVKGFQILGAPIFLAEHAPDSLGSTVSPLKTLLGHAYVPYKKTSFSCLDDPVLFDFISHSPYSEWVLVGFEAHICILQTAKGLLRIGKKAIVINHAITSRSIYDFSTAIAEMRDEGVRITSAETLLFEWMKGSHHPDFKLIQNLVKASCKQSCE